MKLGICTGMNPLNADKTGIESAVLYSESGFDYLEYPVAPLMALSNTQKQDVIALTKEKTVPCLAMSQFFPSHIKVTGKAVDKTQVQEYVHESLELAEKLGVEHVVVGSSGSRNLASDFPIEKGWEQLVELFNMMGDVAQKKNIVVVIEPLNKLESNIITSFTESIKLTQRASHSHVKCLLDSFHFFLGNEDFALIDQYFSMIGHIHFSNVLGRTIPLPTRYEQEGNALLKFLFDKKYSLKMSIEGYSNNLQQEVKQVVPFIKSFS